jgi:chromosome segregation ATPase
MALNYNKHKEGAGDSFWTSYSDLFLGMSVVFLLLYVTASLRTGASGLQAQVENKKLTMEVQALQNQLKMYDSIKKDYLDQEATPDEERQYNELMDKLSLLQEEAKDEKNKIKNQVEALAQKEMALNKYQSLVRNMINANTLAKSKIQRRETVIEKQDVTIDDQTEEIQDLESDVSEKKQLIAENERKIETAEKQLEQRQNQLKKALKQNKLTQAAYKAQMAKVQADAESKLDQLRDQAETYEEQLNTAQGQLGEVKSKLAQTEGQLQMTAEELQAKRGQLDATKGQLGQTVGELNKTKAEANQLAGELGATKTKAQQLAGELGQTKGQLGQLAGELGQTKGKLGQLQGELGQTKGKLGQLAGELGQAKGQLGQAQGQIGQLQGDLARAKAEADARKEIAKKIKAGFAKAGVKADVDERTGEVVINFGDVYFDNDSSKLKPKMKEVLEKAMPEYSKALFADGKLREKVTSVEVIGFASPTYKGKYIDPKSLDPEVRRAVDYNLDLSYQRARSIFQHIFDSERLTFQHQKDLLPLIKVTGRSFLAEKLPNIRNPSSKNYCDQHDCKRAQRVIIKFSFDDKK